MKRTLVSLSTAALALVAMPATADVSTDQIKELETRIVQLETNADAPAAVGTLADKIKMHGFMSAGIGYANAGGYLYDNGLNETVSYKSDSVFGLQIEGKVADKVSAVTQLLARGSNDFTTETQWAYISYKADDNNEFRIGRMLAPFYLMSEYREVGYAYPWAQPPPEVYISTGSTSFDGVGYLHAIDAGNWHHDMYVNFGGSEAGAGLVKSTDAVNLGLVSGIGNWQFEAKLSSSRVTVSSPLFDGLARAGLINAIDDQLTYTVLGVQYDNGQLLVMAEGSQIEMDGLIPDSSAGYVSVGYRFGKFMPHLTWASSRIRDKGDRPDVPAFSTQDDLFGNPSGAPDLCPLNDPNPDASLCLARVPIPAALAPFLPPGTQTIGIPYPADFVARILEKSQDSVTLGVRYDATKNVALKFDWTHVLDAYGTFGMLTPADGNFFLDPTTGTPLAIPNAEFDVLRFVVDVVF